MRQTLPVELGTKAESLARLRPRLQAGRIEDQVSFTCAEWESECAAVLDRVQAVFGKHPLIVRSSTLAEDGLHGSSAGAYKSLLGIPASDRSALRAAIDEVIESYGRHLNGDQVLVQRLLRGVAIAGVIMTRPPTLGAPYRVISFDDSTGSTETVTSGSGTAVRSVFLHRSAVLRAAFPARLQSVIAATRELEELVANDCLDVEFALTEVALPHILQVRPITLEPQAYSIDDDAVERTIGRARERIRELQQPSPIAVGDSTQLSVMADWNPAEMIGTVPGRLAVSLYRNLITDEAWAVQRANAGYRDVRPHNLIIELTGHPYVDLRVDFNSFVPADLSEALAKRLVDHYLSELAQRPELHDKVEFEIVLTCLAFDFERRAERLRQSGFSGREIETLRASLRTITANAIRRCAYDVAAIPQLDARYQRIMDEAHPPLERAWRLLEEARSFGAPLFAHLARQGFVAAALLTSLRAVGHLTDVEVESLRASVETVSRRMLKHAHEVADGVSDWEAFVSAYGHLRPGSYDITSDCYAAAPERYLRPVVEGAAERPVAEPEPVRWRNQAREAIDAALREVDLGVDCNGLLSFMTQAIEGRELGKFQFTKYVNAALEAIAEFGARHGVTREALAHIRIEELMTLRDANAGDLAGQLFEMSDHGLAEQRLAQAVCLPAYIACEQDLLCFEQTAAEPNYVTRTKIRASVVTLRGGAPLDLQGTIVLIPSADPGYDWLFSRGIAGLITMHGGVNSHMAVRAAEFGLPAAIGVGVVLFDAVSRARMVELDCASRQTRVLD